MRSFEEGWKAWGESLERYRSLLREHYRDPNPKKRYAEIEKFWGWMLERRVLPSELSEADFVAYCKELESGKLCRETSSYSRGTLVLLRGQVLRWTRILAQRGELLLDPFAEFRPGGVARSLSKDALSVEQVEEILGSPDESTPWGLRDRAVLEVTYGSGLRLGELAALDLGSLDLSQQILVLRSTKSGWDREVPLTSMACRALCSYLEHGRPEMSGSRSGSALWLSVRGSALSYLSFPEIPARCSERLGFRFTFHELRHACATHLLEGGAKVSDIAKLLGHECLESTEVYARARLEELRKVHRKSHPRG